MKFLKNVWLELNKVVWPDKNTTALYTLIVILVSLFVAYYIAGFDYIFTNFGLKSLIN